MLLIFEKQFPKLIQLCPHIEILSCAPRLADQVNKTLLRLSFPLKNLTVIPYSPEADYNACALLYRHSLTEYTIGNLESSLLTVGFDELKSFTNLKKLSLLQVPWCMFQDVEYILSMCPHVQDLSVDFCNETDDKHHVDLLSKLPLQQHYPRLKSLTIQCSLVDVHLNILYPVLRKCKNLSRLKLVGTCGFFDMAFDVPHNLEWDKLIEKLFETTNWK
jgi:hypothetical protein